MKKLKDFCCKKCEDENKKEEVDEASIMGKTVSNQPHIRKVRYYATKDRPGVGAPHWVLVPYRTPAIYKSNKRRKTIKETVLNVMNIIESIQNNETHDISK